MISKPVKTSISSIGEKKILSVEDALKVRDNIIIKTQRAMEVKDKSTFDDLWVTIYQRLQICKKISL